MHEVFDILRFPALVVPPQRLTDIESWHLHTPFAFLIIALQRPKLVVELGTHRGDSYCAFCQAVDELALETTCVAVDHWKGDDQTTPYSEDVYEELCRYHDPRYGRFSRLLRSSFDDAAITFNEGSIDLLHIDGHHTYESVQHDYETWLPKMSCRGVILFHDIRVRDRDFGVWKLWEELRGSFPNIEFSFGHGLGVLAVGAEIDADVLSFFRQFNDSRKTFESLFLRLGLASSLSARQPRLESDLQQTRAAAAEIADRLAIVEGNVERKAAEVRRLSEELGRKTADAETAKARAQDYGRTVDALRRSLSWRATAPFRAIASLCLRLAPQKKKSLPTS